MSRQHWSGRLIINTLHVTSYTSNVTCHMSQVIYHASHITCHTSYVTHYMSCVTCQTSCDTWHVTSHMSHITCHTLYATRHTSYVMCHTSQVICHVSHVIRLKVWFSWNLAGLADEKWMSSRNYQYSELNSSNKFYDTQSELTSESNLLGFSQLNLSVWMRKSV